MHILSLRFPVRLWRKSERSADALGWSALAGTIAAGSTYNAFAKVLTDSLSPLSLVILGELLALLFLVLWFGAVPLLRECRALPRRTIMPLLAVGLLSGTIAPLLLFAGLRETGAVNAVLFGNTEMLFLLLLAVAVLGERLEPSHYLSIAAIAFGIVFIAFRGFTEQLSFQRSDLLLILASFTFSVGSLVFRRYLHEVPSHTVILSRSLVALVGLLFVSFFLPSPFLRETQALHPGLFPTLLGFVLISRLLSLSCFYKALDHLPVSSISLFSNLHIITSILFTHWFLGEPVFGYQVAGGAFIIFGAVLLELTGRHHPSPQHQEAHLEQRHSHRV
ncbi:MAG: DMT family transporter [Candidatus Peribacteraceae bacterium]|nr:DMT family transporter [Candidatus Peribacteraceae bacterium]